jgi:hypothetical protein
MDLVPDLVVLFTGGGIGTPATDMFSSTAAVVPAGDGPYTVIKGTGGPAPQRTHNDAHGQPAHPRPSAQVVVIAKSPSVAKAKAKAAFALCAAVSNQTINSSFYMGLSPVQSEPFDLQPDDVKRARFAFNVNAT